MSLLSRMTPIFCLLLFLNTHSRAAISHDNPTGPGGLKSIAIPFVQNEGNGDIAFCAKTFAGSARITRSGNINYAIPISTPNAGPGRSYVLNERLLNATPHNPAGLAHAETKVSYFRGNDPALWKTGLATWKSVSLGQVYNGITARVAAHAWTVEKIFEVAPDADPSAIAIALEGTRKLTVATDGRLEAHTPEGIVRFSKPIAFQVIDGKRKPVKIAYAVSDNTYSFNIGQYDRSHPLTIDPLLASTFFGGATDDYGTDLVVDSAGNVYVTGFTTAENTSSTNHIPTTPGSYDEAMNGGYDIFISKFDSSLSSLEFSTFLGGDSNDYAYAIAIDSQTNIYIGGKSCSTNFPTHLAAYSTTKNGTLHDMVVSRFDDTLTLLSASTYIGGHSVEDELYDLLIDNDGMVVIAGKGGTGFPTTSGAYSEDAGVRVARFDSGLSTLVASSGVGGGGAYAVATDASGNFYVAGYTYTGSSYPTTQGAYGTNEFGSYDGVISKLNSTMSELTASTYLGGYGWDYIYGLALDSSDKIVVCGGTWAGSSTPSDFPTTTNAYDTSHNGDYDAFVSVFDNGLSNLVASTFVGGTELDKALDMKLDSSDNVYFTGRTESTDYPVSSSAFDSSYNGNSDLVVSRLNSTLSQLSASTFLGGTNSEANTYNMELAAMALGPQGTVYLTSMSENGNYPTTSSSYDMTYNDGKVDAVISRLDSSLSVETPSPVYRLYSYGSADSTYEHLWTTSETEKNVLDSWPSWQYESIAWYAYLSAADGTVPLYRLYSSGVKQHHYTIDATEYTYLDQYSPDWSGEGIQYYVYATQVTGTLPAYRFYHAGNYLHHFTISETEKQSIEANPSWGYVYEGIAYYVYESATSAVAACASPVPQPDACTRPTANGDTYVFTADYDGDGVDDIAAYDEITGEWLITTMFTGEVILDNAQWGGPGMSPFIVDQDGDGLTDLAVIDDVSGARFVRSIDGCVLLWEQVAEE